eukprot:2002386-Amphidinium_carterae.2
MSAWLLDREHGDAASASTRVVLSGTCTAQGSLAWATSRVMSLLGWDGRTRNLEPDAGLRCELPKWGKWFAELALNVSEHTTLSPKALRAKGQHVADDAPPFASLSTF